MGARKTVAFRISLTRIGCSSCLARLCRVRLPSANIECTSLVGSLKVSDVSDLDIGRNCWRKLEFIYSRSVVNINELYSILYFIEKNYLEMRFWSSTFQMSHCKVRFRNRKVKLSPLLLQFSDDSVPFALGRLITRRGHRVA